MRDLVERPRVARDALPQRGQRRLAGRVDEQRADVVEELVADGARDRPVAQLLVGARGSSRPTRVGARGRAAASGSRPGRRARRGDRCAARRRARRATSESTSSWVARRPRGPPGARPPGRRCRRSAGDTPVAGSMSKNRSRSSGSAQKRLASSAAMWLGTTSRTAPARRCVPRRPACGTPHGHRDPIDSRPGSITS